MNDILWIWFVKDEEGIRSYDGSIDSQFTNCGFMS
jgi:hypothetical protein